MRKSMSESLTSLNSSSRRSADGDARGRAKQAEVGLIAFNCACLVGVCFV